MRINIRHRVRHRMQVTTVTCWHSCLLMAHSRRIRIPALGSTDFSAFLNSAGELSNTESSLRQFATQFHYRLLPDKIHSIQTIVQSLQHYPVIALGYWFRGLHAYVINGIEGDYTPNGTEVLINNPDPLHHGEDHYPYSFFIEEFQHRKPFRLLVPE